MLLAQRIGYGSLRADGALSELDERKESYDGQYLKQNFKNRGSVYASANFRKECTREESSTAVFHNA